MRFAIEAGENTNNLCGELGIRGVPVSADEIASRGARVVAAELDERGQAACQIAAFAYNALRPDEAGRRLVRRALEASPELGAPCVVIAGGNYHHALFGAADRRNRGAAALDELASELAPLVEIAERHEVPLSVEPYVKGAVYSAESFVELHRRLGSEFLRVNLDITSLYDLGDMIAPDELCRAAVPVLAEHVGLIHVKGVDLEEGFHIHAGLAPITADPTDWELVLSLAAAVCPTDTWILLEHVLSAEEARTSVAHLRRVAADLRLTLE